MAFYLPRPESELGHPRRDHVDGMSAIAPIATELLQYGNGRKGPISTNMHRSNFRQSIAIRSISCL